MIFSFDASEKLKRNIQAVCMAAALTLLALTPCLGIAQSQIPHPLRKQAETAAVSPQEELTRRLAAVDAAQKSGNPQDIAEANRALLAEALYLMGQLRISEGAYGQAAELYRASLEFHPLPGIHAQLAMAAELSGNADEGLQQAKLALAPQPDDPHLYITLGRAYIAKKQYAAADTALIEADHLHPDLNTLYSLATSWLAEGQQPGARHHADEIFHEMAEVAGDSGSLHVLMGRAYRDGGLMPDAVKQFKLAIQLDPATPHAHYFLGLASLAMNEWQPTPEATSEMEKELQYHPKDFIANYMLGYLGSTQHQYAKADQYLKTAVAVNPSLPDPYLYLGLDEYAEGDNQAAEAMLRKAVELTGAEESRANYQIRRAYVDLGRILAKEGREQESDVFASKARDLENKVMQQTQQNASAMLLAEGGKSGAMPAVMPLDKPDARAANASADPASHVDPTVIANSNLTPAQRQAAGTEEDALRPILGQGYSDLATAEAIQRDYPAALKNYQAAEKWDPKIPGLDKNLGQAAYHADNYPEAVRGLAQAVKESPDSAALRAMLGMAYFEMKRYGDAANSFYPLGDAGIHDPDVGYAWAASLTKDGDLKDAAQVLASYQSGSLTNDGLVLVGQLWTEIGDYDRAIAAFRQIVASNPSFPKIHFNIAVAEVRAEKWADARAELNEQMAATPDDPDAMYYLGFVDLQESKNDDAIVLFQRIIGKHPDYANAQYQLGKLLMDSGNAQAALPHLEAAARLLPDTDYVHYQLQAAYRKLSRAADADRELAVYQQIKTRSRAESHAAVDQQLQQQKP